MVSSMSALLICGLVARAQAAMPSLLAATERQIDFVAAVYLLIGFLFVVIVGGGATLLIVSIVRGRRWEKTVAAESERVRLAKLRPDGKPWPPVGRGMCEACASAFDKVYYLADGRRLCEKCYASIEMGADSGVPITSEQEPS